MSASYRARIVGASVVLATAAAAGCGGSDSPTAVDTPKQGISAVAGAGYSDTVLVTPVQALVVEVRGPGGALAKGSTVRFSVRPTTDTTRRYQTSLFLCRLDAATCGATSGVRDTVAADTADANGRAKAQVRLGTIAGPTWVIVTVPEYGMRDSVPFTVQPGPARVLTFARRDTALLVGAKATLKASVRDAYGNARADAVAYTLAANAGGTATLDAAAGTITAVDVGTTYAYARAGAGLDSMAVRVIPPGRLLVWDAGAQAVRLFNTDGSAPRALAANAASDVGVFPRFSPSGTVVAFHDGLQSYGGPAQQVVIVDSTGNNLRTIGLPAGVVSMTQPRPMADGTVRFVGRGAYTGYPAYVAPAAVYSIAVDGTVTKVADLPATSSGYGGVEISPDGTRAAFVAVDPNNYGAGLGLRVVTLATGQVTAIDANGSSPAWSPKGDQLAYVALTGSSGTDGIMTMVNADGTGRTAYTAAGTVSPGLAWSPTAAYIMGRRTDGTGLRAVRLKDGANVAVRLPYVGQFTYATFGDYYQPDWR